MPALAQEAGEENPDAATEEVAESSDVTPAAVEPAPDLDPLTADDPDIPYDQLAVLVEPLIKEQLQAEADAWYLLLQEKAQEISDLEYQIKLSEAGNDGELDEATQEKIISVTELKVEESSLVNLLNVVLDSLEAKGGDVESYRNYANAVTGLKLDIAETDGLGLRLVTWIKSEEGGVKLGLNALKFIVIMGAAFAIAPRAGKLSGAVLSRVETVSVLFRGFIVEIIERGVLALGIVLALASVGISLGPLLALLGGLSFVLAFALQSNLGNFASGIMLLVNKPFDVGDEIAVSGNYGTVKAISLASTQITDFNDNHLIILPNNLVWGNQIDNYTSGEIRRVMIKVNISFQTDLNYISSIWKEICTSNSDVVEDPKPSAFPYTKSYDYYITVGLKAWVPTKRHWFAYADLLKAMQTRFTKEGIEFVSPEQHRTISQKYSLKPADDNQPSFELDNNQNKQLEEA